VIFHSYQNSAIRLKVRVHVANTKPMYAQQKRPVEHLLQLCNALNE